MTELKPSSDCLLVFLDEVGHETFAGNQHYFGYGGCAVMARDYEALKLQWRAIRQLLTGGPDQPIHAYDVRPTPEQFQALKAFFAGRGFFRLGVATTKAMIYPGHLHSMQPVIELLKKYIVQIAALTTCTSVALILESSKRGDPLIQTYFGVLEISENGHSIPVEHCFMEKKYGEIGLEVADFIVSATGSQTRRFLRRDSGFAKDFQDVFQAVPRILVKFCLIESVTGPDQSEDALIHELG
ncbi:DUF3800 domain-containing protein [Bradyrhizobium sp. SZCCHNR2026]|uniref:DUF3800 domain-containing protein n=1 Tax=Bradyrhizobium sp. SZCCHNR2026 TaxID=3057381 RepID=UPI002915D93E|nr:DUF3800 domain-containing protein [Bradyrhizobium sp. SZCCHNR2026]